MEHLTILIPTKNRVEKLSRCLASIPPEPWLQVIVACDGGVNAEEALRISQASSRADMIIWCRQDMGLVARVNLITPIIQDGLMGIADDIEFRPSVIEKARDIFNREFPDDDGVLGFHQEGIPGYCPTAISIIGQKFLQRYSGKRPLFPGYHHFYSDKEIYDHAKAVGKFVFAGYDIAVIHHQGGHEGRPCDDTHRLSRINHRRDAELYASRKEVGLVWGLNQ